MSTLKRSGSIKGKEERLKTEQRCMCRQSVCVCVCKNTVQYQNGKSHTFSKTLIIVTHGMNPKLLAIIVIDVARCAHQTSHASTEIVEGYNRGGMKETSMPSHQCGQEFKTTFKSLTKKEESKEGKSERDEQKLDKKPSLQNKILIINYQVYSITHKNKNCSLSNQKFK